MRKNPAKDVILASVAPLLPYAVVGVVFYLWGDKIISGLMAKIAGKSSEEFKKDVGVIKSASAGDLLKGTAGILTFGLYDPSSKSYTTQAKAITDALATAIKKGWITQAELPYPTATSMEQLLANKSYVNKKMTARKK